MTWPTEQAREAVARAIGCRPSAWDRIGGKCLPRWCGTHQADWTGEVCKVGSRVLTALAPHVAALVRAERAAALRDAADDLRALVDGQHPDALNPDQWLLDRADAEEAGR